MGSLCSNPFCLYVTATLAFNIPPIVMTGGVALEGLDGCKSSFWLIGDAILCAINIWAAFYTAMKYRQPSGESRGFARAKEILCYDPAIAIYIIFLVGFFVWLCVGTSWVFGGSLFDCSDFEANVMDTAIALGFSFFGIGFMALCIALILSCCMDPGSDTSNTIYEVPPTQTNPQTEMGTTDQQNQYEQKQDVENNYPSATAVPHTNAQEPIYATVVEPSAPPMPAYDDGADGEAKAAASGAKIGAKLGNMVNATDKTKVKLESTAAKASVAANKGFKALKQMTGITRKK
jgi:hypothetical protein